MSHIQNHLLQITCYIYCLYMWPETASLW